MKVKKKIKRVCYEQQISIFSLEGNNSTLQKNKFPLPGDTWFITNLKVIEETWFPELLMWQRWQSTAQICCRRHRSLTAAAASVHPLHLPRAPPGAVLPAGRSRVKHTQGVGTRRVPSQTHSNTHWVTLMSDFSLKIFHLPVQIILKTAFSPRFFFPSPPSFLLFFHRCQICVAFWRYSLFSSLSSPLFFFLRFYWFIFRKGKRGRKRGKKTLMCGWFSCTPCWGPGLQPRHVPWLGIEPATLWSTGTGGQSTEPHQPGLPFWF